MNNKLSENIKEFLDKDSTRSFLNVAQKFIDLLETKDIDNKIFYQKSHSLLIELYFFGHKLEYIDLESSSDIDFVREELFENKNAEKISELDLETYYWEVFDPAFKEENESGLDDLVDDFNDIYRDLKIELEKINKIVTNEAIGDALWQLKFSFNNHWGQHCISAMRALHFLDYDGKKII